MRLPPSSVLRAAIALVVLATWAAPGARALGVGLHVALDQHHAWNGRHHEPSPLQTEAEKSISPAAGLDHPAHRHLLDVPEAAPPATRPGGAAAPGPLDGGVQEAPGTAPLSGLHGPPPHPAPPPDHRRRGSPVPLIYAHCSLLR